MDQRLETNNLKIINNLKANRFGKYLEREIVEQDIVALINDDSPIVLIHGKGGIGKSSLMYNVALKIISNKYVLDKEIDKVFWFSDADSPGQLTATKVFDEIRFICGIDNEIKNYNSFNEEMAEISSLFDGEKLSLLIIDNFETITDKNLINFVLYCIPNGCKTVLISKFADGHFREKNIMNDRLDDCISDYQIPKFTFEEWKSVFDEKCAASFKIKKWSESLSQNELSEITKLIYEKLDGNIFGMLSVVSQIAIRRISDIGAIKALLEDEGLYHESYKRILNDSWDLLSSNARLVLLAAALQGLTYVDFSLVSKYTDIVGAAYYGFQIGSPLEIAHQECLDLNLMESDYVDGKSVFYLSPLVYNFIVFHLLSDSSSGLFIDDQYQRVINNWINYYIELASSIGFCYNDTKKMKVLDEPNQRFCLQFVLDYCYAKKMYRQFIEISRELRYFFYTRCIWVQGDNCIHIKRANAARLINDGVEEMEALVYYFNIASKYKQFDYIDQYLTRINDLNDRLNFQENYPETYFRYKHAVALYLFALGKYDEAMDSWNDILSDPIVTSNIHDIDAAKRWQLKCFLNKQTIISDADEIIMQFKNNLLEAKSHNFERGVVDYSLALADLYLRINDKETAEGYLSDCYSTLLEIDDKDYLARYYLFKAIISEETDESSEYLKKSIDLYRELHLTNEIRNIEERIQSDLKLRSVYEKVIEDDTIEIYFVRHLPTDNNLNNTFAGRSNVECNEQFIRENGESIHQLKENVAHCKKIYCSPLKRALQTASLLFASNDFAIDERLIERDLGSWSGVSKFKIKNDIPEAYYENGNLDFSYTPTNGESFNSLLSRVGDFLISLLENDIDQSPVCVVTHNGIITAVKCILGKTRSTKDIKFHSHFEPYYIKISKSDCFGIKEFINE